MVRPSVSSPARRCKADKATRRPGTDTPHPMTFDAVASWAQVGKVALDGHLVGERDLRAVGRAPGAGRERRLKLELQVRRRALAHRHGADECQRRGVDRAELLGPTTPSTVVECEKDTLSVALGRKPLYSAPYPPLA